MTQNPLLILFSAMFVNNIILVRLVGLCPLFKTCAGYKTAINLGLAVTIIMIITALINSAVHIFILVPYGLLYLRIIIFVITIFVVIYAVKFALQKLNRKLHDIYNVSIPSLSMNCAILAVSLLSTSLGYGLLQGIAFSAGCGLGLTLATTGFLALREKVELIPAGNALKGYPLQFITASLMALAMTGFYGFLGLQ